MLNCALAVSIRLQALRLAAASDAHRRATAGRLLLRARRAAGRREAGVEAARRREEARRRPHLQAHIRFIGQRLQDQRLRNRRD